MDLRERILSAKDTGALKKIYVPQWSCDIWLRQLSAREVDAWEISCMSKTNKDFRQLRNVRARWAVRVCCGEDGKSIFSQSDEDALGAKSAAALSLIWDEGRAWNGMTDQPVDDALKNSEADPSECFDSALPLGSDAQ